MPNHMGIILQKLVSNGRISGKSAEVVKEEYLKFFDIVDQNLQSLSSFNPSQDRVDALFSTTMGSSKLCANLWDFVKMFLILYHGQATIERGFSINKQLLVENMKPKSLVALRRIEDHMKYSEQSPETIKVPNKMIRSVKEAHSCCQSEIASRKKRRKIHKNCLSEKLSLPKLRQ